MIFPPHHERLTNRRDLLRRGGAGFGALALSALMGHHSKALAQLGDVGGQAGVPLGQTLPHTPGKAKNVIFLYMEGGPSHLDICDPKPLLNKLAGQKLPPSFGKVITAMGENNAPLLGSKRAWKQHGQSGLWFSDWVPHIGSIADDLCVLRSCVSDGINHAGGMCEMNSGSLFGGRPCLGSWVSYGLGTENQNLPAFVVMKDSDTELVNGVRNWSAGFMPAAYQGVLLDDGPQPIANLNTPKAITEDRQRGKLDFINQLNGDFDKTRDDYTELDARIKSYELAFRMQAHAPEVVDLHQESDATRAAYGMDQKSTANMGRMCLMARRMVEKGVRFVQVYHGAGSKWDSHQKIEANHSRLCHEMDKPVAALIKDLKERGLLESTLVIWGGEFGRTPMSEKGDGRDHNPTGFSMFMAGGGVKGGTAIGQTDELGLKTIDTRLHVHDLHATILYLLGVDHTKLVFRHQGRPERIDMNEGKAYKNIMGTMA